ncbi:MAG: glucose-6-phosphate isomerase [Candidatus Aminicenantes bacterium]|nr:glucose-6-phosphate isomerase [Candidatus Aminicenantes bacterium]
MTPLIEYRRWRPCEKPVAEGLEEAGRRHVVRRLWSKDFTLWKSADREISNRLGWLEAPERAVFRMERWLSLAAEINNFEIEKAVLLGMGGSSLAPEVFSRAFRRAADSPELIVQDSTVPEAVKRLQDRLIPEKALFLVSSKSGTTLETLSLYRYFYEWMERRLGPEKTGRHFLAITDSGTPLEEIARRRGFLAVLPGEPDIGGRFSVFSAFGLFSAALLGLDVRDILRRAGEMSLKCREEAAAAGNPGLHLGVTLGRLAALGIDKLMLVLPPEIESFGAWLEQLIAESTGKEGRGILPVCGEPPSEFNLGREDSLWAVFRFKGEPSADRSLARLDAAGKPHLLFTLESAADLAGQFFLWETAVAVAGWSLGINPFDQPDVAASKKNTEDMLDRRLAAGGFPDEEDGFVNESEAASAIVDFSGLGRPGDYIGLQAFLAPGRETDRLLGEIADALRSRTRLPVTWGYGPRFLHSTGQLHKGDGGRGLFIQFSAEDTEDLLLPREAGDGLRGGLSFGVIKDAQARGDFQALRRAGRRVMRIRLTGNPPPSLEKILANFRYEKARS